MRRSDRVGISSRPAFSTAATIMLVMMAMTLSARPASCLTSVAGGRLASRAAGAAAPSSLRSRAQRRLEHYHRPLLLSTMNPANDNNHQPWHDPSLMDHMLHRIKAVNSVPYDVRNSLIDFTMGGQVLGKVTPKVAERLASAGSPVFQLSTGTNKPTLTLGDAAGATVEQRTKSVARVMEGLRDSGYVTGWRDEMYPVAESFGSPPLFLIERAAASLLGVMEYGVHINGLVEVDGETKMWMARRSRTKSKFPGFLDHIVAGGQPAGLSLMENVVKECAEEAGIPEELTRGCVRPAGAISYETYGGSRQREGEGEMNRVVLFCYDLTLPGDFVPSASDGEVESFFTWGLEEIGRSMDPQYDDPIKPNCYPVIIDYLLRSGAISPDSPKYLEILRTLRSGTCK